MKKKINNTWLLNIDAENERWTRFYFNIVECWHGKAWFAGVG